MKSTAIIQGWHAHVYFDAAEEPGAQTLCTAVSAQFGVPVGRMHRDPVGPHPTGSCQISVPAERVGEILGWLALNRAGLTVFCHAETGDVWADHTDHVVWLGESQPLRLDALPRQGTPPPGQA